MQNIQNYIEIQVHNKIMQSLRQKELQYKTKIIQLQKQKQYEINRANQYQMKFKQALLQNGAADYKDLVQKLTSKQNQNSQLRFQILKLKRSVEDLTQNSNNYGSKSNSYDTTQIKHLINQNQQMAKTIQQLKNAAISAIMAKDDEIQELNQKITKAQELSILYQNLLQRQQSLQQQIQKIRIQSQQQQKVLTQKLTKQRQKYLQKLQQFQKNLQHEQLSKQELLQKAQSLESNLQNKQQIIELYQRKLNQFQYILKQQQNNYQKEKEKLLIDIDNLKDKNQLMEKDIHNFEKIISELKFKERESKIINDRLRDQISELDRKLSIKKRKNNTKLRSSDIYSSFEGISQKSSFYSSFYKPNEQQKTTLGEITELEENDVLEEFIDLEERQQKPQQVKQVQLPKHTKKKNKTLEVQISTPSNVIEPIQDIKKLQTPKPTENISQQEQQKKINQIVKQTSNETASLETIKVDHYEQEIKKLKKQIQQFQQQIKSYKDKTQSSKKRLQQSYQQIQRLTKQISSKTQQIQKQRQALAQLRSQNLKSQSQKELMVEYQNLKQHVFKLQNALLIQKLQNAEKEQFVKQRNERQRKNYEQKIKRLNQQIVNLSPKKKKGFFR